MRYAVLLAAALVAIPARAHVGVNVSNARFSNPPPPNITPADLGDVIAPYTFPTADQTYTVSWDDGDIDPTGRFFFYYMDHDPTFQVLPSDIESMAGLATPIKATSLDPAAVMTPVAMWAGCTCADDAGVVCPDAGVRDCRNQFEWDTSAIPSGSYWVVAVNNDPPYHVYSVSMAPVRIAHGGAQLPPAAMIVLPDGLGAYDKSYRVQWLAVGKTPLKIDLAYGLDEQGSVFGPVTSLAKNVMSPLNPDGSQVYDWDVSGLESLKVYFLRVTVTDADGTSSYTDSRFGLSIYHPPLDAGVDAAVPGDGGRSDGGVTNPPPKGCSCDLGATGGAATLVPLGLLLLTLFAAYRISRRRS
jgi:MYXO-CTERM domain-containing protein